MKILKIATYDWKNASRDKRELSTYQEMGHEIIVLCKGNDDDRLREDSVDGYNVLRLTTKPLGNKCPTFFNKIINLYTWVKCVIKISPDVISGENIQGALVGALAKSIIKLKKVKLIYDAHEFHIYDAVESDIKRFFLKVIERFILKSASFTIVVNDSILNGMKNIYKFNWNAVVVMSMPLLATIDYSKVKDIRDYYNSKINVNGNRFIIEFHGYITKPRNVEMLIELLTINNNLSLVLIGEVVGDSYKESLIKLIEGYNLSDRVLFIEPMAVDKLYNYLNATDIGIVIYKNTDTNYYFMSPNKFFENIQAENPMLCSAYPELTKVIDKYKIGLTVKEYDLYEINECIEKIRTNKELYQQFKNNLKKAKLDLCWEKEKNKLIEAFKEFIEIKG